MKEKETCQEEVKNDIVSVSFPRLPNDVIETLAICGASKGEMMYFLNEHYIKIAEKEHQCMMELYDKKVAKDLAIAKINIEIDRMKWKTIKWLGIGVLIIVIVFCGMFFRYNMKYGDYAFSPPQVRTP